MKKIPSGIANAMRVLQIEEASEHFLPFAQAVNPDPNFPDNPEASRFQVKPHHRLIAEALEEVERGDNLRLIISMPPQHGKSEQISRLFPAWFIGRNPWRNLIFGTYSQDFATDFGAQVRAIMRHEKYGLIFPQTVLRKDSTAKDYMVTTAGGQLAFIGRGGAGTGKPADLFVIDDPIKDDQEAQSPTLRNQVYQWFTKVAYTRCHSATAIIIVHTRWHEDDLIGRLVDQNHPDHDPEIARDWKYINIPAVVESPELATALGIDLEVQTDPIVVREFGSKPIAALWSDRFSLRHLASAKRLNKTGFVSLYQGCPTPNDGDYFKREWVQYYNREDLPGMADMNIYAASDHAATTKSHSDPSVLGCVGVDKDDNIYILPDLIWEKMETDRTVEEMIALMKRRKPKLWFAESDVIKKSIGPFLRKRMQQERVYTPVLDMPTKQADKMMRARSVQGRLALGTVFFPRFAGWTENAVQEMLRFPNGAHDDFVDFMAWIGIGLDSIRAPGVSGVANVDTPTRGTFGWLKWQTRRSENQRKLRNAGW